jgi:hypothetical protein
LPLSSKGEVDEIDDDKATIPREDDRETNRKAESSKVKNCGAVSYHQPLSD